MTVEAFAPAKINLTLHVTDQRVDGYHLLDSLTVFADVGDRLWFSPRKAMHLDVDGPFASGVPVDQRNLVWRAAELAGWRGHVRLEKNLPHGGGIGGGSSDAGAVLRAVGSMPADRGLQIGADVPVCVMARAARMSGVGDHLSAVPGLPELFAVLANPGVPVATPQVFKRLKKKDNPAMAHSLPRFAGITGFVDWLAQQRNDLQNPAISVAPEIGTVLTVLRALPNALMTRMSGSGSTCFALFGSRAQAASAAKELSDKHPTWWVQDCTLS
ncbi:4-(cytidine 5'-diphospho)-2-C-methyl-D-erythritol kinase [Shimia abyssi]|uniref:4-diphosphocytidyl-2-C-methyl-D-erythritol kinase n=1 Tax=Shimia abyssi TaxID=1662395 RepID=A0A2P8FGT7_9RHOB|nr:4-(cytidine 5'-diphospho)-2-C-methyl-D-erythritol kinase [Shimia abyssi]PSL20942.1 4-diphosphocytidyl-2-C-methyl-D-erythritol kinase [Shimia abyssi]